MKYLFIILLVLTSCKSLLVSGVEVFDFMYVENNGKCEYQRCIVITRRLGIIGVNKLAFYLETGGPSSIDPAKSPTVGRINQAIKGDAVKILIQEMEFDPACVSYHGLCEGVPYTVKYTHRKGHTTIEVSKDDDGKVITLSDEDICK